MRKPTLLKADQMSYIVGGRTNSVPLVSGREGAAPPTSNLCPNGATSRPPFLARKERVSALPEHLSARKALCPGCRGLDVKLM